MVKFQREPGSGDSPLQGLIALIQSFFNVQQSIFTIHLHYNDTSTGCRTKDGDNGNKDGDKCMFPFVYGPSGLQQSYDHCLNAGRNGPWCKTGEAPAWVAGGGDEDPWGYCVNCPITSNLNIEDGKKHLLRSLYCHVPEGQGLQQTARPYVPQ